MENHAKENNVALDKMSLEELEEIWQKISLSNPHFKTFF